MDELVHWCSLQTEFSGKQPYSELLPLIDAALSDGHIDTEESKDILWICNNFVNKNEYFDCITASIQQLHGIAHGILADNAIDDFEIQRLSEWIRINDFLRGTYPFDEMDSLLTSICADHYVDEAERMQLKAFLGDFVDTKNSIHINLTELDALRETIQITGICAMCPDITFKNNLFCFTGVSSRCKRDDIAKIVFENNGVYHDKVTQ